MILRKSWMYSGNLLRSFCLFPGCPLYLILVCTSSTVTTERLTRVTPGVVVLYNEGDSRICSSVHQMIFIWKIGVVTNKTWYN